MRDKKRSPNFTTDEVSILLKLVKKYQEIIECKQSDKFLWKNKVKVWKVIEDEFNAMSGTSFRNAVVLRKKFENMKKDIKKRYGNKKCDVNTNDSNKSQMSSKDEEISDKKKAANSFYDTDADLDSNEHNAKENGIEQIEYIFNQRNNNDFFYMRPSSSNDCCELSEQEKVNEKWEQLLALKLAFYERKTKYLEEEHNIKMKILELELKAKELEFSKSAC